jgi:hypothetical protein
MDAVAHAMTDPIQSPSDEQRTASSTRVNPVERVPGGRTTVVLMVILWGLVLWDAAEDWSALHSIVGLIAVGAATINIWRVSRARVRRSRLPADSSA